MSERYVPCYGSLCLRPYLSAAANRPKGSLTGDIRRHTVDSARLGSRDILVYLPPGYSANDNYRYPLAVLQDGQNIFDAETAVFGVEWGVDETAERLIVEQKLDPVVLVAVYNSERRVEEYTPFPDPDHGGGQADLYADFLVNELLPFLESHYCLARTAEHRAVLGSSLGGLVSLYLAWTRPQVFGQAAALSPSLWWGRRGFITLLGGGTCPEPRPKLWLDAGTLESPQDGNQNGVPDLIDDLRTLRAVLLSHGYRCGTDLLYREVSDGRHDERSWSRRVGDVLEFFFPKTTPVGR